MHSGEVAPIGPTFGTDRTSFMNASQAIRLNLDLAEFACLGYLQDMTDAELLVRPCPGTNHINWQVGHLIESGYRHMGLVTGSAIPPLPGGFAARYKKENAGLDDAAAFLTKEELLATYREQRVATLVLLERQSDADLDRPTGVPYAPTVGAMFSLQGSHWLMHSGQWVIVRRILGRKAMF